MANAVATIAVSSMDQTWFDGKMFHVLGTVTIGASPLDYVSGGIAMSLSHPLIKAQRAPQAVYINSQNGYTYAYVPGADVTTGLLKIFTALGVELTVTTIPAGNSGDTITFEAIFLGQN